MNSGGQFLLYDAILAFLILFVVLLGVVFVLEGEDDSSMESNPALDRLLLLSSIDFHGENLLSALGDDSAARDVVRDVLSGESFVLRDLTSGIVLVNGKSGGYVNAFSARKIVGGHEYELTLYV